MLTFEASDPNDIAIYCYIFGEQVAWDHYGIARFANGSFRLVQGHNPNREHFIMRLSENIEDDYQQLIKLGAIPVSPGIPNPMLGESDFEFNDSSGQILVLRGAGRLSGQNCSSEGH